MFTPVNNRLVLILQGYYFVEYPLINRHNSNR